MVTARRAALCIWLGILVIFLACAVLVRSSNVVRARHARARLAALAAVLPHGPIDVAGVVLDPHGRPVCGATVHLGRSPAAQTGEAQTGADGSFCFRQVHCLPHERLYLQCDHPGYALSQRVIWPATNAPMVLQLCAPAPVRGVVSEASGKPILDAEVTPSIVDGVPLPRSVASRYAVHTDRFGRFVITRTASRGLRLTVRALGYATYATRFRTGSVVVAPMQITLSPGYEVAGRVVYEGTHGPAPGLTVACQAIQGSTTSPGWEEAQTDSQGRYRLRGLSAGRWTVHVSDPKVEAEWTAVARGVDVGQSGQTGAADLVLIRGGIVRVTVLDADTGAPVKDAAIGCNNPARPQGMGGVNSADTGPDGIARLRVPAGDAELYVEDPGPGYVPPRDDAGSQVNVVSGHEVEVSYRVRVATSIAGRVIDASGRPLPGARIWAGSTDSWANAGGHGGINYVADKDGRFTLRSLPPGARVSLWAETDTLALGAARDVIARDEPQSVGDLRLTARRGGSISGRVVAPDGTPVPGAQVRVQQIIALDRSGTSTVGVNAQDCTADARGKFTYSRVFASRTYMFSVSRPRKDPNMEPDSTVTITAMDVPMSIGDVKVPGSRVGPARP